MKRFYLFIRDLHLYFGLFISPFLVVYAVSVIYLVHPSTRTNTAPPLSRTVRDVQLPDTAYAATGRAQVDELRPVLDRLGIAGEVNFVRRINKERRLVVPISVPGRDASVDLNFETRTATITERSTGTSQALVYLHKMPGPHNANVRGNWVFTGIWKWLADATTYLLLFITISGIYLWTVLRAERRIGLILIAAGAVTFFGAVYALI